MGQRRRRRGGTFVGIALALLLALPALALGATASHFTTGLTSGGAVDGMTVGPEFPVPNVWFTNHGPGVDKIGRITPAGVITEYEASTTPGSQPRSIVRGLDGNLWYSMLGTTNVGVISPTGLRIEIPVGVPSDGLVYVRNETNSTDYIYFTRPATRTIYRLNLTTQLVGSFDLPAGVGAPFKIIRGPDGNIWFTYLSVASRVGRMGINGGFLPDIDLSGDTGFTIGLTTGPDGNVWVAEQNDRKLARITPAGVVTEFPTGTSGPNFLTTGADGNLWFTSVNGEVGRMTPAGQATLFPGLFGETLELASGGDGAIWLGEAASRVGRLTTDTLPGSVTSGADTVSLTEATLRGSVNPSGLPTVAFFQYGTAPGVYTASTPAVSVGTALDAVVTATVIGGLTPDTVYYFRQAALNGSGLATGAEFTLRTNPIPPPPPPPPPPPVSPPPAVTPPPPPPPSPPPVVRPRPLQPVNARVRYQATLSSAGVRLDRFSVIAPRNARVIVRCQSGCGLRRVTVIRGTFATFDTLFRGRLLRVGTTLEITVTRSGALGRYFTFKVTRRDLSGRSCVIKGKPLKPRSCVPYLLS